MEAGKDTHRGWDGAGWARSSSLTHGVPCVSAYITFQAGFQSEDPLPDFRGTGLLCLQCMIHFSRHQQGKVGARSGALCVVYIL